MVKGRGCLQPDWDGSALFAQQSKEQGRTQRDLEGPGQWPEGITGEDTQKENKKEDFGRV